MPTPIPTQKESILDDGDNTFDDSIRPSCSGGYNTAYMTVAVVMRKGRATMLSKCTAIYECRKASLVFLACFIL